ncbi:MAG: hypothetical protein MZW92_04335 [Comamonadaceae bacterium]|nr:hypothetical protein [Comamonadaceae bacterium]
MAAGGLSRRTTAARPGCCCWPSVLLATRGADDDDARLRASAARWPTPALQYLGIVVRRCARRAAVRRARHRAGRGWACVLIVGAGHRRHRCCASAPRRMSTQPGAPASCRGKERR